MKRDLNPIPPPSPGPPAKYNDAGTRRFRVEILQVQLIDIDVAAGPSPDDQDPQVVAKFAADLMNAVAADPTGWRDRLLRLFPEVIGSPKYRVGEITDVGPGVQADWIKQEQRELERADRDANLRHQLHYGGRELESVEPLPTNDDEFATTQAPDMNATKWGTRVRVTNDPLPPILLVGDSIREGTDEVFSYDEGDTIDIETPQGDEFTYRIEFGSAGHPRLVRIEDEQTSVDDDIVDAEIVEET